jgi:hypothetical protein
MDGVTMKGDPAVPGIEPRSSLYRPELFLVGKLGGTCGETLGLSCHALWPCPASIKGSLAWPSVTLVYVESSRIPPFPQALNQSQWAFSIRPAGRPKANGRCK